MSKKDWVVRCTDDATHDFDTYDEASEWARGHGRTCAAGADHTTYRRAYNARRATR